MWAHAEYVKLLRSASDGKVFDLIPAVEDRYQHRGDCTTLEVWKPNRHIRSVRPGVTLRIQAPARFRLRWSDDEWKTVQDTPASDTILNINYVDIPVPSDQRAPIRFTFHWLREEQWEARDLQVSVQEIAM